MDDADKADGLIQGRVDEGVDQVRKAAQAIPAGKPGECELCGEWWGRLVGGVCAGCRDKYKLK